MNIYVGHFSFRKVEVSHAHQILLGMDSHLAIFISNKHSIAIYQTSIGCENVNNKLII